MPPIDHVIVLVLENRSFDHMLGFLDHPNPAFERLSADGRYSNPGWGGASSVSVSPNAKPVLPIGPDHSHDGVMEQLALDMHHRPTNRGFVTSLERTARGMNPPAHAGLLGPVVNAWSRAFGPRTPLVRGLGPLAMLCQPSSQVPVFSQLALSFAVCTRWFCSVPGETWPNRNFLHAATSDGETNIDTRLYDNPTIFELLEGRQKTWRIYYNDTPQVWAFRNLWDKPDRHANWYPFADFARHVAAGDLPSYSFIEPNHRPPLHLLDDPRPAGVPEVSDNQHPENNLVSPAAYGSFDSTAGTDFRRAETLVATVYEALRANRTLFERSLFLVTYDEHGGFYDHEPPPVGVPSPGTTEDLWTRLLHLFLRRTSASFDFTMLGPRVPAVVISPLVPAGTVDGVIREHSSVPSTLRHLFAPDAPPLTSRDQWAQPFDSLATLATPRRDDLPDLSLWADPGGVPTAPAAPVPASRSKEQTNLAPERLPTSYKAFVAQAEQVHRHLVAVGEEEATTPLLAADPTDRGMEITRIFSAAAERHRAEKGALAGEPL